MRYRLYITLLSLLLTAGACEQLVGPKVVYLAHTLPVSHPVHQGMEVFAEEVRTNSKGALDVRIFPDGQLGTEERYLNCYKLVALP